jgi:hypothetical protein
MLAAMAFGLLSSLAPHATAGTSQIPTVFFVSKSQNRNEVHYSMDVNGECRPSASAPVHPYWLMREKGPGVTEPLLKKECAAYGIKEQQVDGTTVRMQLTALPSREIYVQTSPTSGGACNSVVTTVIAGSRARLYNIHVYTASLGAVDYILLTGWRDDGTLVRERIKP